MVIIQNDMRALVVGSKLKFLIEKIWDGKYSHEVDGKLEHFSHIAFMAGQHNKRLPNRKFNLLDVIDSKGFEPDYDNYSY